MFNGTEVENTTGRNIQVFINMIIDCPANNKLQHKWAGICCILYNKTVYFTSLYVLEYKKCELQITTFYININIYT